MEGSSTLYVTSLPVLVAMGIVVVKIMFLIYHETSHNHVFKGLYDLLG